MLLALPANFRLSWKLLTVTNTLDDHDAELITTVKSFLIQPRAFNLYANEQAFWEYVSVLKTHLYAWGRIHNTLFYCNFRVSLISQSVTLHQAGKPCQGQTFQLIGPIRKLRIIVSSPWPLEIVLPHISPSNGVVLLRNQLDCHQK